ncbi:MAG TPA: FmdB family zinc ribbon protein [Acidimicrobiales bacterium]|nr:FmdB family zinc ribbon protein [Acidimicrobiales bacterium]
MPTYEYACKSCGEHLEVVQSFKDQALTTCPACGGSLRKVFGSIGISFKGSGFYKTDSRSTSSATAPAKSSDSSGSSSDSSPSSTPSSTPSSPAPSTSSTSSGSSDAKAS